MSLSELQKSLRPIIVAFPAAGLLVGFGAHLAGWGAWSRWIWTAATIPVLLALLTEIVIRLGRGDVGLDIIAALSMTSALIFNQPLAAVVVSLMYAGGQYLESFAERHAGREMTALLARVPRTVLRYTRDRLEEIRVEAIEPADRLLIRQGDMVPVDGTVLDGLAVLDQSALTGESIPVQHTAGDAVMSGSTNTGTAFDLVATHRADESTYAGIVRLVEAAQRAKAPMSRLADRFAMVFLAVTLTLAGAAWFWSRDPVRLVAVLVVATPCPLILAVPVAIVSGLSLAAKHGILVKGGPALETLAQVQTLVIDKTGTLTRGHARLVSTQLSASVPADEVLRVAASLDQASQHIIARTLVQEAHARRLDLAVPTDVVEAPGEGIEGAIDGRRVIVGGLGFVAARTTAPGAAALAQHRPPGAVLVGVGMDGRLVGVLVLADELRAGTATLLSDLRRLGVQRIVLATGDRREVAAGIAAGLPIDLVRSELTPDQKVLVVLSERKHGPVMMVGDGVNDAPALAAADLGVAMGAKGAAASAEAADVVLLVDQLDRIVPAMTIARRSRGIALESVYAGMGGSIAGMVLAALGFLTPVAGAVLQEVIDVAVVLNALRSVREPR